ncbi:RagB/SusD family nutrient uptake outer membrane protein [Siphonobacter aquaeclarae]|uniref:RagB/SusD domain-containing protein n=1 Tax=Siphonobacter aquaeclarae TaxID=563176 RepID=A0A1G9IUE3_9BACT|nr:RagB/SusD family nutrient uptake outer membrane protein [Siphonobacter aquaeclarae]SDL28424.1 RagB/SusD domain-containing protein [Siphonobacter aquaeclarae]
MTFKHKLTILVACSIGLASCKDSFLDIDNPSQTPTATYYSDSASLANAVTGAYAALQRIYGSSGSAGMYLIGDLAADNGWSDATAVDGVEPLVIDATNTNISALWIAHYRCIQRCNNVIGNAGKIPMGEAAKKRYLGEVKFIRALCNFNLVRIWGKVPLVVKDFQDPSDAYVDGRNAVEDVYSQINADLTDANGVLPNYYAANSAGLGRATRAAVLALWGEVLLTQKNHEQARIKLKELVENESDFGVALLTDYASIFSTSNKMNREIIFAIRYKQGINSNGATEGSPFNNWFMPQASDNVLTSAGAGYYYNLVHSDLSDAFEQGDLRKDASVGSFFGAGRTQLYTKKFINSGAMVVFDGNNDWIVSRYADVLLQYAEALNEAGQTADAGRIVNRVRKRAGLNEVAVSSQSDMRLLLEKERRLELNMEGHRWFDLKRTDRLLPVVGAYLSKYKIRPNGKPLEAFRELFPIPLTETQVNPKLLPNNDGY